MIVPNSTYRIQFNKEFRFEDARKIASYLASLGITTLYASPIFFAKTGSMHGYDVVEPNSLNPELGTTEDFIALTKEVKNNSLYWLQDIVPNHMSYSKQNQMLIDLLENGPNSRYFDFFDIEWNHPHQSVRDRLLAPFLGKFYKNVLEDGELILSYSEEGFSVRYYENELPIKVESYADILGLRLTQLRNKIGRNHPDTIKYLGLLYVLKSLPTSEEADERYYQIKFIKTMLWELYNTNETVKMSIDETIKIYNGEKGNADSFNLLDNLLREQHYRLSYWRVANEEINYRRFFNISELISLRMELESVFNRTHSLIFKLLKEDVFHGLRIDHVDGLYDPAQYLTRLKERTKNTYVIVEKILELSEELPHWPVEGTSGYEFMNYVNGLFIKRDNENFLTKIYTNFTQFIVPFEQLMFSKKRLIITARMAGDVERLAFLIEEISSRDRFGIDITMHGIKRALEEVLTYFPVYRTYINKEDFSEQDKRIINEVFESVREENPRFENEYNYIYKLLMRQLDFLDEDQEERTIDFIMKFQQLTGPLMAKGFEDTALYIYNRLLSLNEVGGNPDKFGFSDDEFHLFNLRRFEYWNKTMNASSTHDTKRGEDVRARINVLSEIPHDWEEKVTKWNELNRKYKTLLGKNNFPDRNDEYFLYQTLIGSFPFEEDEYESYIKRIQEYAVKAVREAKIYTAWIKPNEKYEKAYTDFIANILDNNEQNEFLKDFREFNRGVSFYGMLNSLSQLIIKITSPGIPDFYQGTELWDLSLVDPDNRRPVDYNKRLNYLEKIKNLNTSKTIHLIQELFAHYTTGEIKLFTLYRSLDFRNKNKELFINGDYKNIKIEGEFTSNLFGFSRTLNNKTVIVLVPRFFTEITQPFKIPAGENFWDNTFVIPTAANKKWINCLTGEELKSSSGRLSLKEIFHIFPYALLTNE